MHVAAHQSSEPAGICCPKRLEVAYIATGFHTTSLQNMSRGDSSDCSVGSSSTRSGSAPATHSPTQLMSEAHDGPRIPKPACKSFQLSSGLLISMGLALIMWVRVRSCGCP